MWKKWKENLIVKLASRFEIGDAKLDELLASFGSAFGSANFTLIVAFPFLRHIVPEWSGWNQWKSVRFGTESCLSGTWNCLLLR